MDFPLKHSDFPWLCESLPEGNLTNFPLNHNVPMVFRWFSYTVPPSLSASFVATLPNLRFSGLLAYTAAALDVDNLALDALAPG